MKHFTLTFSLFLTLSLSACKPETFSDGEIIKPDAPVALAGTMSTIQYATVTKAQPKLSALNTPSGIEAVLPTMNCRLPLPRRNAKLVYVKSYLGGVNTPMSVTRESHEQKMFKRVDVLVTATDKPVFLVLGSYQPVAWHVQTAPGVRIDGVISNGYYGSVIFNGADERRTAILSFHSPDRNCSLRLTDFPRSPALIEKSLRDQGSTRHITAQNKRIWEAEYKKAKETYDADIRKHLKRRPDISIETIHKTAAVLVGPRPSVPFEQKSLHKMQILAGDEYTWGGKKIGIPIDVANRNQIAKRSAVKVTPNSKAFTLAQEKHLRTALAPPDKSLPKTEVQVRLPGCSLEIKRTSKSTLESANFFLRTGLALAIQKASSNEETQRFADKIAEGKLNGTTFVRNQLERHDLRGVVFSAPEIEKMDGYYLAKLKHSSVSSDQNASRDAYYEALADSVESSKGKSNIRKLMRKRARAKKPLALLVGINDITEWSEKHRQWEKRYFDSRGKALQSPHFTHFAFSEMVAVKSGEEKFVFGKVSQPRTLDIYGQTQADLRKQIVFLNGWQRRYCL